jgi:hypothetical protein
VSCPGYQPRDEDVIGSPCALCGQSGIAHFGPTPEADWRNLGDVRKANGRYVVFLTGRELEAVRAAVDRELECHAPFHPPVALATAARVLTAGAVSRRWPRVHYGVSPRFASILVRILGAKLDQGDLVRNDERYLRWFVRKLAMQVSR